MKLKTRDSAEIHYTLYNGLEDPILIIPGLFQSRDDWKSIATLQNSIVVDTRGSGSSTTGIGLFGKPLQIDILQLSTDCFEIITSLGVSRFYVLGSCFGGLIALQLALLMNGREDIQCLGLILVNTCITGQIQKFSQMIASKEAIKKYFGDVHVNDDTMLEIIGCIKENSQRYEISKISCPIVSVQASNSLCTAQDSLYWSTLLGNNHLQIKGHHWIHKTEPHYISRIIERFKNASPSNAKL